MNIATLTIEMAANVARLRQDMESAASVVQSATAKMQKAAELAGKALGLIGVGLSIAALNSLVSGVIASGAALDDLRMQTGATVEALTGLLAIGKFNNVGAEQLGGAMNKLASNMAGATEESKGAGKALEAIGINFNQFKHLRPEEQMQTVAKAMAQFEDGSAKSAVAMALFGKQGAQLLPFMNDLATAGDIQAKMTTEQAAAAARLDDNLLRLTTSGDGWKKELVAGMIPALDLGAQALLDVMNGSGGVREEVHRLVADGSIKQWTMDAITGLSYVIDVGAGVVRVIQSIGKYLGATGAAMAAFARGDLQAVAAIRSELGSDLDKLWSEQTLGQRFRAKLEELSSTAGTVGDQVKKSLDFTNVLGKDGKAAKEAKDPFDALLETVVKAAAAYRAEAAAGEKLTDGQRKAVEVLDQVRTGKVKLSEVQAQQLSQGLELMLQAEEENKQREKALKIAEAVVAARKKEADGIEAFMHAQEEAAAAALKSVKDRITSLKDEEQATELARSLNISLAEAVERVAIARLQEKQAGFYENSEGWENLQREIATRQELLALMSTKALREREAAGWADLWGSMDRTAHDVWTNIWEGGSNVFKKLGQTIKATVLDLLYQLTVRPFIIQLGTSIFGSGFGSVAQAATGGGSPVNVLGNIGNIVSTGMNLLTNGVSASIASAFGKFATSSIGTSLGLSTPAIMGNNPSAYVAPQMTGLGSTIGAGLGMLGNGMMGYGISSALSGGYTTGGNTVNILAGIASAFFGPLAGVVGGIINRLFGRKLADMGIEGSFGGAEGFDGRSYEFYKGGLFRSDKTKYSGLDPELEKALGDTFKGMRAQVAFFADTLGLSVDKLEEHVTAFKFSTQGLNAEQIQAKFQDAMATANNELAEQVLGTWETTSEKVRRTIMRTEGTGENMVQHWEEVEETITNTTYKASEYAKEGEKAIDTLTRLATSLITVNSIFDTLGYTLLDASLKGADAASKIAEAFGGLDKMTAATSSYFLNYYSKDERRAVAYRQLDKQLDEIGIAEVPKTREGWRRLAESQDLNTEAGRKAYAVLIQLSSAFAELTESAEDTAAALEAQARELVQTTYDLFRRAVQRDREALNEQAAKVRDIISGISDVVGMLRSNARELALSVESTAQMMAVQGMLYVEDALAGVRAGAAITDYTALADAIGAARGGIDKGVYVSQFERDRDALVLAGQLQDLGDLGDLQLTVEERQLKGINDQLEYLDSLDRRADALVNGTVELTGTVSGYFEQLLAILKPKDAGKPAGGGTGGGGDGFVVGGGGGGVSKAVGPGQRTADGGYYLENYLGPFGSNFQVATGAEQARLDALAGNWLSWSQAANGDIGTFYETARANGATAQELAAVWGFHVEDVLKSMQANGVSAFASGGSFTNGIVSRPTFFNIGQMGEGGQSEGILPLANVGGRLGVYSMGGGNADVVAELQALRAQFGQVQGRLASIDANTEGLPQMVEHTDQVTEGGIGTRTVIENVAPLASAIAKEIAKELV